VLIYWLSGWLVGAGGAGTWSAKGEQVGAGGDDAEYSGFGFQGNL
jgi:hypothetical protein